MIAFLTCAVISAGRFGSLAMLTANRIGSAVDRKAHLLIAERVLGLPQDVRADKGVAYKDLPTGR